MSILTITFEQAGVVPRKFKRLDMKLKAAIKRVIKHGLLATNIDTRTSQLEDLDQILRGLQILVMVREANRIDQKSAHLFGFNDMNTIKLVEGDLASMMANWEATLARCGGNLDEESILQPMLYGLIEHFTPIAPSIDYYNRIEPNHVDKSYQYLVNACKTYINNSLVRVNRAAIQQVIATGNVKAKPLGKSNGATASIDEIKEGTGNTGVAKGAPGATRHVFDKSDAIARKLCFDFQNGECKLPPGECTFKHEIAKKARPRSPSPPRPRGPPRPKSEVPCRFFPKGTCTSGENCEFKHDGIPKGATATATSPEDSR